MCHDVPDRIRDNDNDSDAIAHQENSDGRMQFFLQECALFTPSLPPLHEKWP